MVTGSIWEKVVFGKWLFAPAFFWEDVVSMLVLALHTAYLGARCSGSDRFGPAARCCSRWRPMRLRRQRRPVPLEAAHGAARGRAAENRGRRASSRASA
jgi:hypothetical protein